MGDRVPDDGPPGSAPAGARAGRPPGEVRLLLDAARVGVLLLLLTFAVDVAFFDEPGIRPDDIRRIPGVPQLPRLPTGPPATSDPEPSVSPSDAPSCLETLPAGFPTDRPFGYPTDLPWPPTCPASAP